MLKKPKKTTSQVAEEIQRDITGKFLDCLNHGVVPWRATWNRSESGFINSMGRSYSFMNTLLLALGGGTAGEYVTMKGIEERTHTSAKDGTVWKHFKRDENGHIVKGHRVYFYSPVSYQRKDSDGKPLLDADGNPVMGHYPILKASTVWQIDAQLVDVPKKFNKPAEIDGKNNNPIHAAESVIINYQAREGLKINFIDGVTPAYSPLLDAVHVPHITEYKTSEAYYSDLLHELIHSTGHDKRLKRDITSRMKSSYSFEELIAEIGSCCIMHDKGFSTDECDELSESYVKGWAKALKSDPTMVEKACRLAIKAANYIYNGKEKE